MGGPAGVGDTFAGRVAGSLLQAVGLPELVTFSPAAHESIGLRLAREPALLQSLQHKLLGNRLNAPLFDIARYTRHFEAALTQMSETWANGHEPMGFAVPPSSPTADSENSLPCLSPLRKQRYSSGPWRRLFETSNLPARASAGHDLARMC